MIDMFALLVTCGMISIVVFFAVRFNREREWFERVTPPPPSGRAMPGRPVARKPAQRPVRR